MFDKKALFEALKELGRVAAVAVIPVLIDGLSKSFVDFRLVGTVAAIAILRAVDKYVHENPNTERNGVLPF